MIRLFSFKVWSQKFLKHINIWRELAKKREKKNLYKMAANQRFLTFFNDKYFKTESWIIKFFFLSNIQLWGFRLNLDLCHLHFFYDSYHPFSTP